MSEEYKKKALAYIKACEANDKYGEFQDFETRIVAHLEERAKETSLHIFTHTFLEYVKLEVALKNRMKLIPSWKMHSRMTHQLAIFRTRRRCSHLWGATPKYHAKIHRKLINDTLIKHRMYYSFTKP